MKHGPVNSGPIYPATDSVADRTIEHLEIVADFLEQITDRDSYAVYVREAAKSLARLREEAEKSDRAAHALMTVLSELAPYLNPVGAAILHDAATGALEQVKVLNREAAEAAKEQKA